MACEYVAPPQTVALNAPIIFNDSVPCSRGLIYHDDGNGTFQLRGLNRQGCPCGCKKLTEYVVEFSGNIGIPEGGTAGPIAIALTIGGEPIASSRGIYTPTAAETYQEVTARKIVKIPWGCCPSLSVEYVSGLVNDPTGTPAPQISVIDGNLTISLNE